MSASNSKVRVTQRVPYQTEVTTQDVDADTIGGSDGELTLYKNEKCVAIYAAGKWVSAEFVSALAGGLPS